MNIKYTTHFHELVVYRPNGNITCTSTAEVYKCAEHVPYLYKNTNTNIIRQGEYEEQFKSPRCKSSPHWKDKVGSIFVRHKEYSSFSK